MALGTWGTMDLLGPSLDTEDSTQRLYGAWLMDPEDGS